MDAREVILRDVRRGLGREIQAPPTAPPVRLRIAEISREERIRMFLERFEKLAGVGHRVASAAEADECVRGIVGNRSVVRADSPATSEDLRQACATSDIGVTSATYALCDTGSLVMMAGPGEPRLASLLPPIHIAVVPAERILSGLDELFTLTPRPADLTSSMVFITGPSRTADIEQILVRGVHGPGEIHAVIVG